MARLLEFKSKVSEERHPPVLKLSSLLPHPWSSGESHQVGLRTATLDFFQVGKEPTRAWWSVSKSYLLCFLEG